MAPVIEWNRLVKSVEISVFVHATESEEKIKTAIRKLLSSGLGSLTFDSVSLVGHYDDPIIMLTLKIQKRKEATEFFDSLYLMLSSLEKERLTSEIERRIDSSGNLYIRLDKQKAYNGGAVMQENDPIRVKVKLQVPHGEEAANELLRHLRALSETRGR